MLCNRRIAVCASGLSVVCMAISIVLPAQRVLGQLLPGSAPPGTNFGNIHFDEQGTMTLNDGTVVHGTALAGGGIDYKLPGPVTPGALLILGVSDALPTGEPGPSDRLDFSVNSAGEGHLLYRSLRDDTEGVTDPADVASFPTDASNLRENGPEGNNSFIYQVSGAIYFGVSDAVPEPAMAGLAGMIALALVRFRGRARDLPVIRCHGPVSS